MLALLWYQSSMLSPVKCSMKSKQFSHYYQIRRLLWYSLCEGHKMTSLITLHLSTSTLRKTASVNWLLNCSNTGAIRLHGPHLWNDILSSYTQHKWSNSLNYNWIKTKFCMKKFLVTCHEAVKSTTTNLLLLFPYSLLKSASLLMSSTFPWEAIDSLYQKFSNVCYKLTSYCLVFCFQTDIYNNLYGVKGIRSRSNSGRDDVLSFSEGDRSCAKV